MKMIFKTLAVVALVVGSMTVHAADAQEVRALANHKDFGFSSETEMQNYFTISKVRVKETASELSGYEIEALAKKSTKKDENDKFGDQIGDDIIDIITNPGDMTKWVTLGKRAWKIVLANRPVANVKSQTVAVLPIAKPDWHAMESWAGPTSKAYTLEIDNAYGVTVMSYTYTIAHNYGGKYQGKGAYIANATVIPTTVDVIWGFKLNSHVEVGQTLNMGTKNSPTPGVELAVKWNTETLLSHQEGTDSFFLTGDGQTKHITVAK
jgi:hypothetical protein